MLSHSRLQGGGEWRINLGGYGVVMGGSFPRFLVSEVFWDAGLRDHKTRGGSSGDSTGQPQPQNNPFALSSSFLGLHLSSVATGTIPTSPLDQHHSSNDWPPLHLSCDVASSAALFACLLSWALFPQPSASGLSPNLHLVPA